MPSNNETWLKVIERLNFLKRTDDMLQATKKAKEAQNQISDAYRQIFFNERARVLNDVINKYYGVTIKYITPYDPFSEFIYLVMSDESKIAIPTDELIGYDSVYDYIIKNQINLFTNCANDTLSHVFYDAPKEKRCPYCDRKISDNEYCSGCGAPV